jgi:hypothetical protein
MSKERQQEKEMARLRAQLDEQLLKNAELQKQLLIAPYISPTKERLP